MSKKQPIYEGKAKKLFEGPEPGTLIQHFKDDATAFNGKKHASISGKGVVNNRISEFLMQRIEEIGVPTHFIRNINMREQLVKSVEIIPMEVIIRNYAAGSFAERFKAVEGEPIGRPIVEFCLKDDRLGDPFISEEHIFAFDLCEPIELEEIRYYSLRINDFLCGLFYGLGIRLVDMKLEFGRLYEGEYVSVVLADEISPDTCRLWDIESGEKMDKDRFRRDLGQVGEFYREVARRLGILTGAEVLDVATPNQKGKARASVSGKGATSGKAAARKTPTKPKPKGK